MSDTKFTKGEWNVQFDTMVFSSDGIGHYEICDPLSEADARLIAAAPEMYQSIQDLIYELNMAIDEVNTMRDIQHKDNLTPADHWDKESLYLAEKLLAKSRGEHV